MLKNTSALLFLLSGSWILGGCAAPTMTARKDASAYYPTASLRLGEGGRLVVHFSVSRDGKIIEPIRHEAPFIADEAASADHRAELRLVEGAERYLREATFHTRPFQKRQLTASFVFEVKPCGILAHAERYDYAINLCRERVHMDSISP